MPLSYNTDSPDSLSVLLDKARAIKTVNQENLDHIHSRRGQHVITQHRCKLQTNPSLSSSASSALSSKRQKLTHVENHSNDSNDSNNSNNSNDNSNTTTTNHQLLAFVNKQCTQSINELLSSWKYKGEDLMKETIAFDYFVSLKLETFDDLLRIHHAYDRLLQKYTRVLADETESRLAASIVLHNLELLQVAVGEIHIQTMNVVDPSQMSEAITSFMKTLSHGLKTLTSKVPGLNIDLYGEIVKQIEEENMIDFGDCETLTCKHTLSEHEDSIWALELYKLDGKQYLASAGFDKTIKLWDMSSRTVIATLTGHDEKISALVSYTNTNSTRRGGGGGKVTIPMLASAGLDMTIQLWDLSNHHHANIHTLCNPGSSIYSLAIYTNTNIKDANNILIGGSWTGIIKLWDLTTYKVITQLEGHNEVVEALRVFHHNDIPYMASGSRDGTIKIWNLDNYEMVKCLGEGVIYVNDLAIIDVDDGNNKILASGNQNGYVKLWSMETGDCIGIFKACSYKILTLEVVRYHNRTCLVCPGDDRTFRLWDLNSNTLMTVSSSDSHITRLKVFMNGNRPCFVSAHVNGDLRLWMK